jgi:heparan sulfate N-deacetylase/N-sulfotransferase NDST1
MFNWFDHSWSHLQPHTLNASSLKEQLYLNYNFALRHGIPVDSFYSVSPHHSGIYPVYDQLYEYWSDILLIKATSTEMYPHGRPIHSRRGFIHKNIMVLPRQPCGVFTHTNFFTDYPNGMHSLIEQTNGGDVFKSVLYSRVVVFMTHMTNYANDRLALFALKELFVYLGKWTNLKFYTMPPVDLATKYFEFYPEFKEPLWTNYCLDKKHLALWSFNNDSVCNRFPKLIIIGPQKTGK